MIDDDSFEKQYIFSMMLECADCGYIFKKEHQYVCPVCSGRNVKKPSKEAFDKYYEETEKS
jgi:rubrerythrin